MAGEERGRLAELADKRFREMRDANYRRTDRLFATLLVAQFFFVLLLALLVSPYTWQGATKATHLHVWMALVLGAVISGFPITLAIRGRATCSRATASPSRRCSGRRSSSTSPAAASRRTSTSSARSRSSPSTATGGARPRDRRRRAPITSCAASLARVGLRHRQPRVVALPRARLLGGLRGRGPGPRAACAASSEMREIGERQRRGRGACRRASASRSRSRSTSAHARAQGVAGEARRAPRSSPPSDSSPPASATSCATR